jgi:O-antigen ligase
MPGHQSAQPTGNRADGPGSTGFWLYALHLATVWGLALSNAIQGLMLLWTGTRWSRLRLSGDELRESGAIRLLRPFVLYCLILVASAFTSFQVRQSLWELRALIGLTTLPLALLWVRGEQRVRRIYDLLIWVSVILAWYGILQYAFTDYGGLQNRIPGPFGHYMTYSGVLLLGVCLAISRLMTAGRDRRWLQWLIMLSILLALGLTLTRNVWLAAFVVLTIAFFVRFRRWLWAYATVVVVGLALTASLAPQHWSRITSMVSLEDVSNYDRICMAEAGLQMIADRPLFGIGPGMVKEYYPIYRHPTSHRGDVKHLHNTLLQLGAERGLLSVVAYLWLMAVAFSLAWRGYRDDGLLEGRRADLYLGVLLAIVAINIGGIFEANWRDTEIQRWMLFLLVVPVCIKLRTGSDPE